MTAQEWGAQRGRIKKLYLDDGRTLKEVMHIMKRDHDFHAT
jgi:Clr5 domain